MAKTKVPSPETESLTAAYKAACDLYQRIDDFRAKLLGFLPLVSGTGIFLLLNEPIPGDNQKYLFPVGLLGFTVTLGLLLYELRGVQKCIRLINVAASLEKELH